MRRYIIGAGVIVALFLLLSMSGVSSFFNGEMTKEEEFQNEIVEVLGLGEDNTETSYDSNIVVYIGNGLLAFVIALAINYIFIKICTRKSNKEPENIMDSVIIKRELTDKSLKVLHSAVIIEDDEDDRPWYSTY